ncbi:hypothetical protein J6590_069014 [Homalodisca vitripennis]|nr:hypothetical protein J6590_069014 [Homalodisca vitripennis]
MRGSSGTPATTLCTNLYHFASSRHQNERVIRYTSHHLVLAIAFITFRQQYESVVRYTSHHHVLALTFITLYPADSNMRVSSGTPATTMFLH